MVQRGNGMSSKGDVLGTQQFYDEFPRDEFPMHDEATGEEHGFELSWAIGELETTHARARRREHDAAAARARVGRARLRPL